MSSYSLQVTATDGGHPALSSTCKVNVLVTDVNDNPPVFSRAEYSAVIQVSLPSAGTLVRDLCCHVI